MPKTIEPRGQIACDIAAGRIPADQSAAPLTIRAAHKNLNSKGNGPCWYRMVWRDGSWQYFASERLPSGSYLASDRRATVKGDVFVGELVCSHGKGGPVNAVWLICQPEGDDLNTALVDCSFASRRDGRLTITLPDGSEVIVPNPRR